jgi:hypothetical protein
MNYYGELNSEKKAREKKISNEIVAEVEKFGISESQRIQIIYKLSLALEDIELMRELTSMLKLLKPEELFISGKEMLNGQINAEV